MTLTSLLSQFTAADGAALFFLFAGWTALVRLIEHPPRSFPSVTVLMSRIRRDWMKTLVTRSPRIVDSNVIDSLRQSTTFFASTSMIAIGGGIALLGDAERLAGFASDLTLETSRSVIETKLVLVILLVANAFLKFVWANRVFGYCSIMIASVPNDPTTPGAYRRAAQAGEINITAARSFNRGLQSVYFAIAALAWLAGAAALALAVAVTLAMMYRREFTSASRRAILVAVREAPRDKCEDAGAAAPAPRL